jgi:hypothetical protein
MVGLLGPATFLTKFGSPETIEAEAATLLAAIAVLQKHLGAFGDRDIKDLSFFERCLESRAKAARLAMEYLARVGWRFDPTTRRVKAKADHRGKDLLRLCIQALGVEYGKDDNGRKRIKDYLSSILELEVELDAGPRGDIARALEGLKR